MNCPVMCAGARPISKVVRFHMKGLRSLAISDCDAVLRINAESQPGVSCLDRPELVRLFAISTEHLGIEGPDAGLVGYLLAFQSDTPYDGEEFLAFKESYTKPFIYIDQVAVGATWRRAGLASSLYHAIEAEAYRRGILALCCEVNLRPQNPGSLAFHRHNGFNQTGILGTRDGRAVALMIKAVEGPEPEARET